MQRYLHTLALMLSLCLIWGAHRVAAIERPFGMSGAGNVEFINNPPTGGNLTASGVATYLGQWTETGILTFMPGPEPHLILASGTLTFTAANGDELYVAFSDAVLNTNTNIATGVFIFDGGTGRFEEASGSADFVVIQDPSGSFELTAIGAIDF